MPDDSRALPSTSDALAEANGRSEKDSITQELVIQIANRIYAMLMRDLKIERERERFFIRFHGR